jgi:hypothetical protein
MAHDNSYNQKQENYQRQRDRAALEERKKLQDPQMRKNYHEFAQHAKTMRLWIFDRVAKVWYTPEEFIEKDKNEYIEYEKLLFNIDLRDPLEALQKGQQKIAEFTGRIIAYRKKGN